MQIQQQQQQWKKIVTVSDLKANKLYLQLTHFSAVLSKPLLFQRFQLPLTNK